MNALKAGMTQWVHRGCVTHAVLVHSLPVSKPVLKWYLLFRMQGRKRASWADPEQMQSAEDVEQ